MEPQIKFTDYYIHQLCFFSVVLKHPSIFFFSPVKGHSFIQAPRGPGCREVLTAAADNGRPWCRVVGHDESGFGISMAAFGGRVASLMGWPQVWRQQGEKGGFCKSGALASGL